MSLYKELRSGAYFHSAYPHEPGAPIVRVADLSVHYEGGFSLDHLSFDLAAGERLAVVGPNGAGKSTLFKAIAGVIEPSTGQVQIAGHEPGGHICIAYLPQRSQVDWNFPATVADTVMMGRISKIGLFRFPGKHDRELVRQALSVVRLTEFAGRQISQLSGGQQQRMFIARALAQEAEVLLMDEPFTGLDTTSQEELFAILDALRERGVTVMVALHDLELAARRFDRVLLLNRRLVGLGKPDETFTPERLLKAYGGRLRTFPNVGLMLSDTCCDEGDGHSHD